MDRPLDVVHIGAASRDLVDDDPRGWRLGGGVTYAALTTARLGFATAAWIGLDDVAAGAQELDLLRTAGVEVLPVSLATGPVFVNAERPGGRVQQAVSVSARLPDEPPPMRWRSARAWSVVPVADELPDALASWIPDGAVVALGWQGLLRTLRPGRRVRRRRPLSHPIVERADLVGLSRSDVGRDVPSAELAALARRATLLCVTDAGAGGRALRVRDGRVVAVRRWRPPLVAEEVDATGAGDVFLAALLAAMLRGGGGGVVGAQALDGGGTDRLDDQRLDEHLAFAAAAGALAVRGPGLVGVPADADAIRRVVPNAVPGDGRGA